MLVYCPLADIVAVWCRLVQRGAVGETWCSLVELGADWYTSVQPGAVW